MMPFTRNIDPGLARFLVSTCRAVALISATFSIAVATLLVANYVQLASLKPLDNPAIADLRARYHSAQGNEELAAEIRALDLAARRAYFTRQWQTRTGGWMLVASVAVLLASLRAAGSLSRQLPKPQPDSMEGAMGSKGVRIALASLGVILLGGGLAAAALGARLIGGEPPTAGKALTPASAQLTAAKTPEPAINQEFLANWPQFRGPGGNGIAGPQDPPIEWDGKSGKNVLWKTPIPLPGRGSPVVWGDRVYLSGADGSSRAVFCWSDSTGKLLWQRNVPVAQGAPAWPPKAEATVGYAAPTMAVEGGREFAIFANADLVALDPDGAILWTRHIGDPQKNYGYASSLSLYSGAVIVLFDQVDGGRLIAVNEADGTTLWETPRDVSSSWTTPVVVDTGNRTEILVQGTPFLASYDAAKGTELWQAPGQMGENAPSPAYANGRVFAACQLLQLSALDVRNGKELWAVYDDFPDVASPLASGDLVIMAASYGVVTCLNAADGTVLWKKEFDTGFYASPILAGGRVYILDRSGVMRIFAADRTMKLLASSAIGEPTEATPAFHDGAIFIRSANHIFCVRGSRVGQ
jgi:outer membrane protein assembly factor BamB